MSDFPLLTLLILVPLAGSLLVAVTLVPTSHDRGKPMWTKSMQL